MRLRAAEVAAIVGGSCHGPDVEVAGASIDSRTVRPGELFVPVVGRRDGHDFIGDAITAGAAAYLSARPLVGATGIRVDDTAVALSALGCWARTRVPDRVVGVTGSVGKTTTKDLLAATLAARYRTAASPRSFNNDLGVPLTLLGAPDGTEAVVVEMGARGWGHIARLCRIASPTVAVVTNVGMSHTEHLDSLDGVARAKRELVESLPSDGIAVLNAGDPRVLAMGTATRARVLTFGPTGDVRAQGVTVDEELKARFSLVSPWGSAPVRLGARGRHMVDNALAAATAALALEVTLDAVAAALETAPTSPWRMEMVRVPGRPTVLNDAYNANPASTEAALRSLAEIGARHRVAVLGPMMELGHRSDAEHRRIGALAGSLGLDRVLTVGAPAYGRDEVGDPAAALAAMADLGEGDVVLVKASRAAGLEELVAALVEERPAVAAHERKA